MSSFSIPTSEDDLDGVYCCPGGPLTILAGASAAPNDCTSSTPILSIPTTSIDINIGGQDNTSTIGGTTVINSNGGIASATSVATPTERSSDSPASTNGAQGPNIPQWMMGAGAGLFLLPAL
ncbi:hypothetical protein PHISCL_08588 [Aspergillus sclerotialis]|uniref:Uncharacterized protein n=1 Tax=Aspergillus sclerotialis TaxID=2070753 RepID=A0A3A2Z8Y4_9EURO|nr:hypothetical protein PHISCL_08588 [Aspergillus sclerotialis]